ncbi:hypothetical protein M0D68_33815 [Paraburkholderia sp. SEWSISQ10-3 4]|uniref:hypothetical protein n=1 Tax=Paraburkholderia TaxID=1822464 RepID=UPI002256D1A3|nr:MULTISPECIES: hypothetical protein [Paraburkholderia]MCX4143219.1 hypothetical protein [Paraburkholderia aspalathi]MDN7175893.1 hypothetical protein [Paraburkholderia sp. SEWSISQ10-3 4]MDQ6505534.1 hypothetical protein [Paraburkholderia aspalathi]
MAGDVAGNAVSRALPDTLGSNILSNAVAGAVGAAVGAAVGGALGGSSGALSGANGALGADLYNKQLHPLEKALAKKLADASNGQFTEQQLDDALRLSGIKGSSITPDSVATVNVASAGAVYDTPGSNDSGSQFMYDGKSTIGTQILPTADPAAIKYIISQTGGANSPYYWSSQDTTPAPVYSSTPTNYGSQIGPHGAGYFSCATTDCLVYNANVDPKNPGTQAMYQSENTALLVGGTVLSGAASLVAPELGAAAIGANGGVRLYTGSAAAAVNAASQGIQMSTDPKKEFDFVDTSNAFLTGYATYGTSAAVTVSATVATSLAADLLVKPVTNSNAPSLGDATANAVTNAVSSRAGYASW